ncbi:Sensor protein ZraS [Stieleria neptunia]|uniref:histidine kinase n=1 Tax=Stieleria neptunia TaxID=2527979 RepID=A0A518HV59_9BACT|nr:HAMP domain-containing sensor histidine kinase [Stieleria neptunia]QDV44748.1 Sensor protein ZraS [Stieleria neptunia]
MQPINRTRIPKPRIVGLVVLVGLWVMFAVWQRAEHVHQCRLIHATLSSQGDALSTAVSNSIQSHRWFSPFVRQQLPSTLETLARSTNVLAIAVVANGNVEQSYVAGDERLIAYELPVGEHVVENTLQRVREFQMQNDPPMPGGLSVAMERRGTESFRSVVVLDRTETMSQFYLEARSRILIFVLGTLLLASIGAVWQFTVRLAQSEGKTRLLTAETRHLRELGQAAAGLAHETRNPLGLIRGWTQRLVDAGLPEPDQQEQAEAVIEECDRVTARINQFLAFARQSELQIEAIPMEDLVAELKTLLQSDLDAKDLDLETVGLEVQAIQADRDQLRQVLFNLLQNAIAFAPEHSKIRLSMRSSHSGTFRIEVADQGPGASEQIVDTLFEPYVTRRPGGTGLGLSIVRRIAGAHDWDVGYRPGDGDGSVFWIDGIRGASTVSNGNPMASVNR